MKLTWIVGACTIVSGTSPSSAGVPLENLILNEAIEMQDFLAKHWTVFTLKRVREFLRWQSTLKFFPIYSLLNLKISVVHHIWYQFYGFLNIFFPENHEDSHGAQPGPGHAHGRLHVWHWEDLWGLHAGWHPVIILHLWYMAAFNISFFSHFILSINKCRFGLVLIVQGADFYFYAVKDMNWNIVPC